MVGASYTSIIEPASELCMKKYMLDMLSSTTYTGVNGKSELHIRS